MMDGVSIAYADHSLRISNSTRRAPRRRRRIGRSAVMTAMSPRVQTPGPVTQVTGPGGDSSLLRSGRRLEDRVRLRGGRLQLVVDVSLAVDAVRERVGQRTRVDVAPV